MCCNRVLAVLVNIELFSICFIKLYRFACGVKTSADDILKYFSEKIGFDNSCKLSPSETICMKCQNLFSEKKKYIYIYK